MCRKSHFLGYHLSGEEDYILMPIIMIPEVAAFIWFEY